MRALLVIAVISSSANARESRWTKPGMVLTIAGGVSLTIAGVFGAVWLNGPRAPDGAAWPGTQSLAGLIGTSAGAGTSGLLFAVGVPMLVAGTNHDREVGAGMYGPRVSVSW